VTCSRPGPGPNLLVGLDNMPMSEVDVYGDRGSRAEPKMDAGGQSAVPVCTAAESDWGQRPSDALWKVRDVAQYLAMSESWVYHRTEQGLLPCVRIGGRLRFVPTLIRSAFGVE